MRATAIGLALSLLVCQVALAAPAAAQSAADLDAARKLFADAMADQDARRYDTALEKFKNVAAVKDTANVRFRIGNCLEALGRRAEALSNYEAAVKLGEQEKVSPDVLRVFREHAAELDRAVPRLSILLPADAPATTEVRVDDAPVDRTALGDMRLDVGHHTIRATAPGDSPFETAVTLPEGGHVSINVMLSPLPPAGPPTGPALGKGPSDRSGEGEKHPPPVTGHPSHVGGWIAIGVGGALAAGSVVSFLLRQSNINTINSDCGPTTDPQGRLVCHPGVSQDEVHSAQDAARWQGPLAIGLGAGAVVGVGLGVWLLATSPSQSVSVAPAFLRDGGLLVVQGRM
jgi:hypothetical protein